VNAWNASPVVGETQRRNPHYVADQRAFFDELVTKEWDTYDDPRWDAVRRYEVARLFEVVQPRRVLDVGCGCGFHDKVMAGYPFVEQVVGIDYSPASVGAAEREYPHLKVRRQVADIRSFEAEPFDLVVSFQVVEHVDDPQGFLDACRVLSSGAVAVFTPNRKRLENRLRRLVGKPPALSDPQHFAEYTTDEIAELAGMEVLAAFAYGMSLHLPKLGSVIPHGMGIRLGRRLPALASHCAVVLR
jgi:SAM-dependent methyltransferase